MRRLIIERVASILIWMLLRRIFRTDTITSATIGGFMIGYLSLSFAEGIHSHRLIIEKEEP